MNTALDSFDRFRIGLVLAAAAIYVLSPVDAMPGLVFDDVASVVLAILRVKKIAE